MGVVARRQQDCRERRLGPEGLAVELPELAELLIDDQLEISITASNRRRSIS